MSHQLRAPPLELAELYPEFFQYLLPRLSFLLDAFPTAIPTSWWRSAARNMEVGGAVYSQHRLGWAVDWQLVERSQNREMVSLANLIGLVGVDEGDHVHVQMYPAGVIPKSLYVNL